MSHPRCIGRFAPSPTGPLHFGSLVTAIASYLQARSQGGMWRVRIEDIDPPREVPGATSSILHALDQYGLEWDGDVLYQSARIAAYEHAIDTLLQNQHAYACSCSRSEIRNSAKLGPLGPIYPGTCRKRNVALNTDAAIRVKTKNQTIRLDDANLGVITQNLNAQLGDFVVRRRDGLYAYQLAVVIDDAFQGITEVVRGTDLLDSTPRQLYLQRLLELPALRYFHIPLVSDMGGEKLSKQSGATPIPVNHKPIPRLIEAVRFLNQDPDASLIDANRDEFWQWAIAHWRMDKVPQVRAKSCSLT